MAHTINHPFSGSDVTSCSYGAQAVAKAHSNNAGVKYLGDPKDQKALENYWIQTGLVDEVEGPIVKMTGGFLNNETYYFLKTADGKFKYEYWADGAKVGEKVGYSKEGIEAKLKSLVKDGGFKTEWQYPKSASEGIGVTEAAFESANAVGSFQAAVAKTLKGELKPGDIVAEGVDQGTAVQVKWRLIYEGSYDKGPEWRMQFFSDGKWQTISGGAKTSDQINAVFFKDGNLWSDIKWKWGSQKGAPPAVSPQSTSIGAMTDEDAAALFVQIKDDLAKARGLNIKGVNKALDEAVYQKIADLTGYKASEILAKVERYKANGNKLSALKKKQLKSGQKIDATKYAKQETVDKAVKELSDPKVTDTLGVYADEDVVKAYIKAKDHVASLDDNPWTLYTPDTNIAFEKAIRAYMKSEYNVDVTDVRLKQHVADYIAKDGKLSVLKKKMVKSGEMEKKADTLKGKAESQFDFLKKSQTKGDDKISVDGKTYKKNPGSPTAEELADLGYTPNGAKVYQFSDLEAESLYSSIKPGTYLTSSPEDLYNKFLKYQQKLHDQGKDVSLLDIIRAFDKVGAKKFNADNAFLYEKKMADWASSPAGKKYIKDKYEGEALLRNQPDLPPDSALFKEISPQQATAMQGEMGSWSEASKSAIRAYTGSDYGPMNSALRHGHMGDQYTKANIINAWKGMRPSTRDVIVHRGTGTEAFGLPYNATAKDFAHLVNETYVEKGFSSTSVGGRAAFSSKKVLLEIEAPKGSYMAWAKPISYYSSENEMILAPNTHFKILRVREEGGQIVLRVRVVHSEGYKG